MKKWMSILLIAIAQISYAEKMDFIDNDWAKARAAAKEQNKYLFVDAYTDWCGWCKVMDKNTFSQDSVAEFMNKNFVSLKLEMEHNYGIKVAMKYRVASFPSYLVFSPDGRLVYRLMGYMEATPFINKIKEALNPERQKSYPGISDVIELDFPDIYLKAFGENGKRSFPDSATLFNYLDQQKDLVSEVNFAVISRLSFMLPSKHQQFFLDNLDKYASLYGRDEADDLVSNFAYEELRKAVKDSSEAKLNNALGFVDKYVREDKDQTKTYYRIHYYKSTGNWKKFAEQVDAHLQKNKDENDQTINGWAWEVYEKAADKAVLEKALTWMKPVIESKPKYFTLDTYAALLYKLGKLKDAEKFAQKAIELGKKEGEKTKETEDLLEKIQKGKKK